MTGGAGRVGRTVVALALAEGHTVLDIDLPDRLALPAPGRRPAGPGAPGRKAQRLLGWRHSPATAA